MKKFVKPLIEGPYTPLEVDTLNLGHRPNIEDLMTNAEIVGVQQEVKKGLVEVVNKYINIIETNNV